MWLNMLGILLLVLVLESSHVIAQKGYDVNYVVTRHSLNNPKYLVLASNVIRPGKDYKLTVTVFESQYPIMATATLQKDGIALTSGNAPCSFNVPSIIALATTPFYTQGTYTLRVEGRYQGSSDGIAFVNTTKLYFSQKSMTILIQTERPFYQQGQVVRFRAIPINTDLRTFNKAVDVLMLDPNRQIMKRWMSRQTNLGTVSLEYQLSDQPVFGKWTIKIQAQGQIEEKEYLVEEYYQTRYEVAVFMPTVFMSSSNFIHGTVMANYTSGAVVEGNLTIQATITQIRNGRKLFQKKIEKEIFFKHFSGVQDFHFPMSEFHGYIPDAEIKIEAFVGEYVHGGIESGFSTCIIYNNNLKLRFLGSSPQVIKPSMPFKAYVAVSFLDNAPLPEWRFKQHKLELQTYVKFENGGERRLNIRWIPMDSEVNGLWKMKIDLVKELRSKTIVDTVSFVNFTATYTDEQQQSAVANLIAVAPREPKRHSIKVDTTTKEARVGRYMIFHVRTNFYAQFFHYVLLSKGLIIHAGTEEISSKVKTFAVPLSPEMTPTSTLVVYHVSTTWVLNSDSITFSVDGISRNNFSVTLNNKKDKVGNIVEVQVVGEPGSYVGLSAIDQDLYSLRAGNELTYGEVLRQMNEFDVDVNSTLSHIWTSRKGDPDNYITFPSSTYGVDANRALKFAGLIALSDSNITDETSGCNKTRGYIPCLLDGCYHVSQRCNGRKDCIDGLDESDCYEPSLVNMSEFRLQRSNRLQRQYDKSWLWKDINIGSKGYSLLKIPVPIRPAMWMISGFGISNKAGFSVMPQPLKYNGIRPFYMIVEMPETVMQNEQIGIRLTIFSYMSYEIEAFLILENSPDYKFVHVEGLGKVESYNPRTSHGQHQHLVWIKPGTSKDIYFPIVPTRLGKFNVTVHARCIAGKDSVTKTLNVKADGIPQYTHTSLTLDLSQGSMQLVYMDTNISQSPIIPYQNDRRYVFGSNIAQLSIVGDVIGPVFDKMPMNAETMIRKPYGTGESSMFNFAANLYMLLHMKSIGYRKTRIERKAFKYLNIDYQRQMSYQNDDGSFSPFRWNSKGSVWLTAFCAKILYKANLPEWENFLYIDRSIISRAMNWLITHQSDSGAFYETTVDTFDRKMNLSSDIPNDRRRFRNVSLTAHVLITLAQVKNIQGVVGNEIAEARNKARDYLEAVLNLVERYNDPYEIAIVSYALSLVPSSMAEMANNFLDRRIRKYHSKMYWGIEEVKGGEVTVQNGRPYEMPRLPSKYYVNNIETTAYALLGHSSRPEFFKKQIVSWLNNHRLHNGGWGSTQDTIVALEALMEYSVRSNLREVTNISVSVGSSSVRGHERHFNIDNSNMFDLQVIDIPKAWGSVEVNARGSGMAILQLSMQYNVDWPEHQIPPVVPAFALDVTASFWGKNNSHISFKSCQSWTNLKESPRSGLAVLEATIPTGYAAQQQVLDSYVKSKVVRNLKRAHYQDRKVIFYFDFLDRYDVCVNYTIIRWYPVANMSRWLPMKVYDYYAPERFNESSYDSFSLYVLNICQVCGSYQCPYCSIFSSSPTLEANALITTTSLIIVIFIRQLVNSSPS